MATNAINSATGAAKQLQLPRQSTQPQQAESAQATEAALKAKKVQPQQAQKAETPQPVTNLQGQRTGTVINLTA